MTEHEWPFDEECPECGEDTYLAARVAEMDSDGNPLEATVMCGGWAYEEGEEKTDAMREGCGNHWSWSGAKA